LWSCANAHREIGELLERILITCANYIYGDKSEGDIRTLPVEHLLSIDEYNNEKITMKALDDWYLSEKKD